MPAGTVRLLGMSPGATEATEIAYAVLEPQVDTGDALVRCAATLPPSVFEDRAAMYQPAPSAGGSAPIDDDLDDLEPPAFLRRAADSGPSPAPSPRRPADAHPGRTPLALSNWLRKTPRGQWPRSYRELHTISLGTEVLEWLELVMAVGDPVRWEEETVVATFLHCLASDAFHRLLTQRGHIADTARAIARGLQRAVAGPPEGQTSVQVDPTLAARIFNALQGTTAKRWADSVYTLTT